MPEQFQLFDAPADKMAVHLSSKTPEWSTPSDFFAKLDKEFYFTLDACATAENAKCAAYYTKEEDGLMQSWCVAEGSIWCNPPYGREISRWVARAYQASLSGTTVVCLIPSRTDTRYFHDYCLPYGELRFIKGRLKFGGHKNSAPFPSLVVVFRGKKNV